MTTPVQAVVFDMDDVLCDYLFDVRLSELARLCQRTSSQVEAAIWSSGFDEDGDRGHYSASEYLAEFNRRLDCNLSAEGWIAARAAATDPNEAVFAMARELGQRMPIALLTNNGPMFKENMASICPRLLEVFKDNAFCSYEFGGAKPEQKVFESLAQRLGLAREALLFIDDTYAYIQGAQSVGVQTHHFTGAPGLAADLKHRGLL